MSIPAENISNQLLEEEVARIIGLSVMDLLLKKEVLSPQSIASQIKSSAPGEVNNTHHVAHYSVKFIMDSLT